LTLKLKYVNIYTDKIKDNKEKIMKKIELKDATGKETVKRETRIFGLHGGRNIGVLELAKEKINSREFRNSEINKINSSVQAMKKNIESFVNSFYALDKKNKEDFLLFYKIVELIDNKKGVVFGFVERNGEVGAYELWAVNDTSSRLQFPQSYYHSGMGFDGVKAETSSISEIKKYIEEKGFKRFDAEKVAEEVFEAFRIKKEEQFQVVENALQSLETI
jgi:hypothetical protein